MRVTVEDGSGQKVILDDRPGPEPVAKAAPREWDGTSVDGTVVKSEDESRFTLCVAYPAWRADRSVAADHHRDFVSDAVLEKAAWEYLSKSPKVGLWHSPGRMTEGSGEVVESYIWRADPWLIKAADGSECVVNPGDWLLGILWTPPAWELIKSGQIGGISMQGSATRRQPTADSLARLRS